MFKSSYQALSAVPVLISLVYLFFFLKWIGGGTEADVYFMAGAVVTSCNLLQLHFADQFIYFYFEEKQRENSCAARSLLSAVLLVSFVVGLFFWMVVYFDAKQVAALFAFFLDVKRADFLEDVLLEFSFLLIPYLLTDTLTKLLNAEGYFSAPILLSWIPAGLLLMGILLYGNVDDIKSTVFVLIRLQVVSAFLVLSILLLFVWINIGFGSFKNTHGITVWRMIRNSFAVRFGHNIHNFFFPFVLNNALAYLPEGTVSCYYYAQKMSQSLFSFSLGPMMRVLQSKVAESWSVDRASIPSIQRQYMRKTIPLYSLLVVFVAVALPETFGFLNIKTIDVYSLLLFFVVLSVWWGIVAFENSYVSVLLAAKESSVFIYVNFLFILIFFLQIAALIDSMGGVIVPVSILSSQIISTYFYRKQGIARLYEK